MAISQAVTALTSTSLRGFLIASATDDESFEMTRRLIQQEGLLVGGSAGTNVAAALRVAARPDLDGPVVTVLPDSWDRYLSADWMRWA